MDDSSIFARLVTGLAVRVAAGVAAIYAGPLYGPTSPTSLMESRMSYAERAYFTPDHCAHVAAWEERNRLAAIAKRNALALREHDRRKGSRARHAMAA